MAMMVSVYAFGVIVLNKEKIKITYKDIIAFLAVCILNTIFFMYLNGTSKTIFTLLAYALLYKYIFNTNSLKSIFSSIVYIILLIIPDLLTLTIITKIFNISKEYCHNYIAGSIIGNIIISILMVLIIYILKKPLRKMINYKLSSNMKIIVVSLLTLITIAVFFYGLINNYRHDNNIFSYLLLIITLMIMLFYLLRQRVDNENMFKKYDDLLTVMKNYESDVEEQRTINHETKNELLTIRSKLSNEKDKELCNYIDSIMGDKKHINSSKFSKFKYLPSNGLKGFLYYKFIEAEEKGISVNLHIAKQIENSFLGKMVTKDFKDLTRILGVYLDNAIEAASASKEKKLGIEIYKLKDNVEMIISNTYDNVIDEEKVGNEKYSTKGKNRGHGLLLVKKILNENNRFESETKITDRIYIQKIKIKEK